MTREPEWTIVTIRTAELPAPQPASTDRGRTPPAADGQDGLFPAGPGPQTLPQPGGQPAPEPATESPARQAPPPTLTPHDRQPTTGPRRADEPAVPQHAGRQAAPADLHRYNRLIHSQRERLQAAVASGDRDQVIAACRDAVPAWNQRGNIWPPDADRWQHALDQFPPATPDGPRLLLEDLAQEPDEQDNPGEPEALFDLSLPAGASRPGPAEEDLLGVAGLPAAHPEPGAEPDPARTAAITNSDVAAAWRHIAADSPGRAREAAEFIAHGTPPGPGAVSGPDDPRDTTAWDAAGLRRTVASAQPGRDGTLTWDQAARWIDAGMTSGDLKILLQAGRVAAFCGSWLEQGRDTADQADAFRDAGRSATAILQDCVNRVTAAAAQAHGPDVPVPADPASYRRDQATPTAVQARILAAIRELSDSAHQAARRIPRGRPRQPDTTIARAEDTSPPAPAGPATADAGRAGRVADSPPRPGEPARGPQPVSDDQIRSAVETFRTAATGDLPASDKDQALAHAFSLAMRHDEAWHHHPPADAAGDRHEVTYRGPFGTDTTLPACCEESARAAARRISGMLTGPVSAITTGRDRGCRETVFDGGQQTPSTATPPAGAGRPAPPVQPPAASQPEALAAGRLPGPAGSPAAAGRRHAEPGSTAADPQPGAPPTGAAASEGAPPPATPAACPSCGDPIDPAIIAAGFSAHPCCDPEEQPRQPATASRPAERPGAAPHPGAPAPGAAGPGRPADPDTAPGPARRDLRSRGELHDAVQFLAARPGHAASTDGPGLTPADTGLGMFLADMPAGHWNEHMTIAAWAMLGRYTTQLSEAGISYDALPRPPGAEHMTGAELAAAQHAASLDMAATWPGMLRARHGARFIRCDGPGATVLLGYDARQDQDLARAAAQIPGHGYDDAARAGMYPFTSLPAVAALAARHGIAVTAGVRALAGAAALPGGPAGSPAGAATPGDGQARTHPAAPALTGRRHANGGGPVPPGAGQPGRPDAPGPAAPLALTGTRPLLALPPGPGSSPPSGRRT